MIDGEARTVDVHDESGEEQQDDESEDDAEKSLHGGSCVCRCGEEDKTTLSQDWRLWREFLLERRSDFAPGEGVEVREERPILEPSANSCKLTAVLCRAKHDNHPG
jgi:hypothetical protein